MAGAVLVALAAIPVPASSGPAGQDGAPPIEQPRRRVRVPAEPSELLTHSPLVPCLASGGVGGRPLGLRVATWNIRAARSASVDAIADELREMQADVIALQEVDVRMRRTGFVDEPTALATALGYQHAFGASIKWDEGDYGLAVLSRWPLVDVRRHRLDATEAGEPRIVLDVTVCAGGRPLRVFNHHADGRAASRDAGFAALREIVRPGVGSGIVVLGDFNAHADTPGVRALVDAGLIDLGAEHNLNTADNGRIDYLMTDGPLARLASMARVWLTDKSDHNAVLADLEW